ncbi:hypothetical protein DPEC_G00121900 [Dallia pectoralis]|uniref:Uncharacterized protein n=1 Tax=Dallia pectoralis TaxID=75939 RepID=A0ACC2GQV3_DALPE|nr:hypothetical protein DPEC_G00121900 [Dallia pectoralis]
MKGERHGPPGLVATAVWLQTSLIAIAAHQADALDAGGSERPWQRCEGLGNGLSRGRRGDTDPKRRI